MLVRRIADNDRVFFSAEGAGHSTSRGRARVPIVGNVFWVVFRFSRACRVWSRRSRSSGTMTKESREVDVTFILVIGRWVVSGLAVRKRQLRRSSRIGFLRGNIQTQLAQSRHYVIRRAGNGNVGGFNREC